MLCCLLKVARVYGTASPSKHSDLRALGATKFVYTDKTWMTEMQRVDGVVAKFDQLG